MIFLKPLFIKLSVNYISITKKLNANIIFLLFLILNKIITCKCSFVSPAQYNFQLCSIGLRIFVYSVQPFNETGFSLTFFDPFETQYYQINISYLDHNWLPSYSENKFRLIDKPKKVNFQLNVKKRYSMSKYFNYELVFKDYFYFAKTPNSELVYLLGYTNDLIGCPQNLCLNAYLDAVIYHEKEKEFYLFRGYYYYKTINKQIDQYDFNLISNNFLGVPSNLNGATYFKTKKIKSGYFLLFVKESSFFIFTEEYGIAIERDQDNFLISTNENNISEESFIKSLSYFEEDLLFVRFESFFAFYELKIEKDIKTMFFKQKGSFFSIISNNNFIENSENFVNVNNEKLIFFKKWKLYEYKVEYIQKKNFTAYEKVEPMLFYDYFSCSDVYPKYFKIDKNMFKNVYLNTLPEPHNPNAWNKLVTSKLPYDPSLLYMVTGMTISFLIISYLFIAFFTAFYFIITSEKTSNNGLSNISAVSRSSVASQKTSQPSYDSRSKKSFLKYSKASIASAPSRKSYSSKKNKSTK